MSDRLITWETSLIRTAESGGGNRRQSSSKVLHVLSTPSQGLCPGLDVSGAVEVTASCCAM